MVFLMSRVRSSSIMNLQQDPRDTLLSILIIWIIMICGSGYRGGRLGSVYRAARLHMLRLMITSGPTARETDGGNLSRPCRASRDLELWERGIVGRGRDRKGRGFRWETFGLSSIVRAVKETSVFSGRPPAYGFIFPEYCSHDMLSSTQWKGFREWITIL